MGGRCAVPAAAAVWAGLCAGGSLGVVAVVAALVFGISCAALALRAPPRTGTVLMLAALAACGAARSAAHVGALERARQSLPVDPDALVRFQGRVVGPPSVATGEATVCLEVESARPPLPARSRLRLRLAGIPRVRWGDRVRGLARLDRPGPPRNPGGFDAHAAANAGAILASGTAPVATVEPARGMSAWTAATVSRWRSAIERRITQRIDAPTRELVEPLVLGDRSDVSSALDAELRDAGLIHLLALSGLHVTWLAGVARGLAALLGRGLRARAIAGMACALIYIGLAGPIPSLARAAATEAVIAGAALGGRALDPIQALAVSAMALLAWAPGWSSDVGFQLSCAATLGLVTIGRALEPPDGPLAPVLRSALVTTAAQIVALPLLLASFHAVSWIAPLSNLAAVPTAGLLLTTSWVAIVCDIAVPGAGALWFRASEALGLALRAIAETAARLPGAGWSAGHEPIAVVLAGVGAALLAIASAPPRAVDERARPASRARVGAALFGGCASAIAFVMALAPPALAPPPGRWWLVALDVGQGDAIALGFRDGWWLIDAGPRTRYGDAGERAVVPFFRWAGVRALEGVALTHDDSDHTGGAPAVRRELRVGRLLAPIPRPGRPGAAGRFHARPVARGETLHVAPVVRALWPPSTIGEGDEIALESDNDGGLVLEVGEGAVRALLLADVDSLVERRLEVEPPVAILKVAHHGSRSSSGEAFLSRARPRVAVISCGRRNAFGHPAPEAVERLMRSGARIERTDHDGARWFEVDDRGVRVVEWRARGVIGGVSSVAMNAVRSEGPKP